MDNKILFITANPNKYCDFNDLNTEKYQNLDIALDKDTAMRLLLRNSICYESILIDCATLSYEDLSDFIRTVRDRISPIHPKIIAIRTKLSERELILLGVDEIIQNFDANLADLKSYPRLFEIPTLAFIEFLMDIVKTKDNSLFDHMRRVKTFTALIARLCYEKNLIDHDTYENTVLASFFHDLGKMFIPESILHKPSRLTQEEFQVMMQHTILGANLFEKALRSNPKNNLLITLFQVSKYHHERYDGKGYPCGLSGEQIPLPARIVAIADVFEALIATRPYRDALSPQQAVQIIKEDEGHFDPNVLEIFLKNTDLFV